MVERRPVVAGNWKMNLGPDDGAALGHALAGAELPGGVDAIVAPPSVSLAAVARALKGSRVGLAAQTMHWAASGAYTGELGASMLREVGCAAVILGHSERRALFGESDEGVSRKVRAALAEGLTPIICVGESADERDDQYTLAKVSMQLRAALGGLSGEEVSSVIVAYEPIWAIGTGRTATPDQAQEVMAHIRGAIEREWGSESAASVRLQYGGSVKPQNIAELIAKPDIDGALVGGASLKAESFLAIVRGAAGA